MRQHAILMIGLALAVPWAVVGCRATRAGYESAPYTVVQSEGNFEIRDYPALTVAETPMATDGPEEDGSFTRLFGFITGKNGARQNIAMTTPVFMDGSASNRTMAFVMPANLKPGSAPSPTDGAVTVRERPAGRYAVLRFHGARSAHQEAAALAELEAWLAQQGRKPAGMPVYAYFDPPWTPPALRRNEVMLEVGPGR